MGTRGWCLCEGGQACNPPLSVATANLGPQGLAEFALDPATSSSNASQKALLFPLLHKVVGAAVQPHLLHHSALNPSWLHLQSLPASPRTI